MSSVVPYDLANKESTPWGVLKKKKKKKKKGKKRVSKAVPEASPRPNIRS